MNEELIAEIREKALEDRVPIMEDPGIEFMVDYLVNSNITSLLEVGTAVGYSSIVFASAKPDLTIVTLEKDESRHLIAKENIRRANLEDRITPILTDAREFESEQMFDCLFLDGPKAHNQELLDRYLKNLKQDGVIIVDDVYFHGYVDDPSKIETRRLRSLVRKITKFKNDMLSSDLYDCEYYEVGDGVLIATRKK